MSVRFLTIALFAAAVSSSAVSARADGSGDPAPVSSDNGKYADKAGNPTFNAGADGTVDWHTYSGFRRYQTECLVCHGPDAEGSPYAPALKNSLEAMSRNDFVNVVVNGRKHEDAADKSVMPSFGANNNVMCYIDDIFVYIRARANGAIPRGRPPRRPEEPAAAKAAEDSCMGAVSR